MSETTLLEVSASTTSSAVTPNLLDEIIAQTRLKPES